MVPGDGECEEIKTFARNLLSVDCKIAARRSESFFGGYTLVAIPPRVFCVHDVRLLLFNHVLNVFLAV